MILRVDEISFEQPEYDDLDALHLKAVAAHAGTN